MTRFGLAGIALSSLVLIPACGKKCADDPDAKCVKAEPKTTAGPAAPSGPTGATEKQDAGAAAEAEGGAQEVDPAAMEKDPNATDEVVVFDASGEQPANIAVMGEFQTALGWTDKYGKHLIVFGISSSEKGEEVTSQLTADFLSFEGDVWNSQRKFRERVEACPFDTALKPMIGDWSITDLDNNGIGEATFAWRVGCRSDLSPVGHKVLVVGNGADGEIFKYVLRGNTTIEIGGAIEANGDYKVGSGFKQAPEAFLQHARSVWRRTSFENFDGKKRDVMPAWFLEMESGVGHCDPSELAVFSCESGKDRYVSLCTNDDFSQLQMRSGKPEFADLRAPDSSDPKAFSYGHQAWVRGEEDSIGFERGGKTYKVVSAAGSGIDAELNNYEGMKVFEGDKQIAFEKCTKAAQANHLIEMARLMK